MSLKPHANSPVRPGDNPEQGSVGTPCLTTADVDAAMDRRLKTLAKWYGSFVAMAAFILGVVGYAGFGGLAKEAVRRGLDTATGAQLNADLKEADATLAQLQQEKAKLQAMLAQNQSGSVRKYAETLSSDALLTMDRRLAAASSATMTKVDDHIKRASDLLAARLTTLEALNTGCVAVKKGESFNVVCGTDVLKFTLADVSVGVTFAEATLRSEPGGDTIVVSGRIFSTRRLQSLIDGQCRKYSANLPPSPLALRPGKRIAFELYAYINDTLWIIYSVEATPMTGIIRPLGSAEFTITPVDTPSS